MATVRYTVVNGQVVAEKRGGVRKFYASDVLGSTVALYDGAQAKTDTFTYWPYGETRTRTGSTATKYKYGGTLGCREQADGGVSMRARVHQPKDGRWMTVDRLWPRELAFGFVLGNPTTFVDPSGLNAMPTSGVRMMPPDPGGPPPGPIRCTKEWNAFIYAFCNRCRFHPVPFLCYRECDRMAREYYRQCEKPGPGPGPFEPPPDGGVGEIAPRPRPGPQIGPWPPPRERPCIRPGQGFVPRDEYDCKRHYLGDIAGCEACCRRFLFTSDQRWDCLSFCNAFGGHPHPGHEHIEVETEIKPVIIPSGRPIPRGIRR